MQMQTGMARARGAVGVLSQEEARRHVRAHGQVCKRHGAVRQSQVSCDGPVSVMTVIIVMSLCHSSISETKLFPTMMRASQRRYEEEEGVSRRRRRHIKIVMGGGQALISSRTKRSFVMTLVKLRMRSHDGRGSRLHAPSGDETSKVSMPPTKPCWRDGLVNRVRGPYGAKANRP